MQICTHRLRKSFFNTSSLNDYLNDFTGFITGISVFIAIATGIFSSFFFQIQWIELSCYVKTKNNELFDSDTNHTDSRIKEFYEKLDSLNF
jgi:hypothetical protein